MGFFDFIFGGGDRGGYDTLVSWVKKKYRDRFHDGMEVFEVTSTLKNLPKERNPGFRKALQKYIKAEKYGNLVKVKKRKD